jgi:flagellar motility protein MotE (MotC chaperone)
VTPLRGTAARIAGAWAAARAAAACRRAVARPPATAGLFPLAKLAVLLPVVAVACALRAAVILVGTAGPAPPPPGLVAAVPVEGPAAVPAVAPEREKVPGDGAEADQGAAASIAPAAGPAAAPVGTADPGGGAKALLEVAQELKVRRERVEARERDVEAREVALGLVAERLDAQIRQLDGLRAELERLLGALSAEEEQRLDRLVKVYEAMKAPKAAAVFDSMEVGVLVPVARRMREAKLAAIVEAMDPAKARAITLELARPKELPAAPPPAPAAGLADRREGGAALPATGARGGPG